MAETGLLSMNRDEQTSTYRFSTDIAGGSFMLVSACTSGLLAERMRKAPQYLTFRYLTPQWLSER
jgi:hypothetical protein